ncbi:diphthine methyl ester synthase [Dermatophagoides pteronyssinus]|uniref:diphthine methyl ester synthase n=1 Tax=Dermatophagoides pteronyssinus TaxID=6956 RepID=UPI003F66C9AE
MLYLIGLGLGDHTDITVKGLKIIKQAKRVYLESYTSIYCDDNIDELEKFYERPVIAADREFVEQNSDQILANADIDDIAFLVVGDPLGATTHTDLILRAHEKGIEHRIIHNASIINACGCCGLQLYNFGEVVSIPLWTDQWRPTSFLDKIEANINHGLHTLCLLDIKVKEQSIEAMMRGRQEYLPPTFMTVNVAAGQLLESIEEKSEQQTTKLTADTICVALARIGSDKQKIIKGTLQQMIDVNMGPPLHSLIIVGRPLHHIENEMLTLYTMKQQ